MDYIFAQLEFKRIQTYLFASPRLRAVLGANASLGRMVRVCLPELARDCRATADPDVLKALPMASFEDPLGGAVGSTLNPVVVDNPQELYRDYGVLVRDGGHFTATFKTREDARTFCQRAIAWIAEELPGILVEASICGEKVEEVINESLFQNPAFQVSHQLGNQPASGRNNKGGFVGADEGAMENIGRRFRESKQDLIGVLEGCRLIPCADELPESIGDIAAEDGEQGYIALIHADGNGIGQRYQEWRNQAGGSLSVGEAEAHGERFFHSMRVAVRRALQKALKENFAASPRAYQLLMLGGDDLLLLCAARHALPFVCDYARALECFPLTDGESLSVGVGVAITKESFPFHRLHAIAETLADSAKQLHRANPTVGSVVDWHISTSTWIEDPIAERRQESLSGQSVLSGKPYPILGEHGLNSLLVAANRLDREQSASVARSQLRALVAEMRCGNALGELAWEELPKTMRATLAKMLPGQKLYEEREGYNFNQLADVVDLFELIRKPGQDNA